LIHHFLAPEWFNTSKKEPGKSTCRNEQRNYKLQRHSITDKHKNKVKGKDKSIMFVTCQNQAKRELAKQQKKEDSKKQIFQPQKNRRLACM